MAHGFNQGVGQKYTEQSISEPFELSMAAIEQAAILHWQQIQPQKHGNNQFAKKKTARKLSTVKYKNQDSTFTAQQQFHQFVTTQQLT